MARTAQGFTLVFSIVAGMAATVAAAASAVNVDPPPIVLASTAGRQTGVQESYCVRSAPMPSKVRISVCADTPDLSPKRLSVVRPGEVVKILALRTKVRRGRVAIRRLGCERAVGGFKLDRARAWKVRLAPGAYEIQVVARRFATRDGRTGDTRGTLGLLVDPLAPQTVVRATDELRAC